LNVAKAPTAMHGKRRRSTLATSVWPSVHSRARPAPGA